MEFASSVLKDEDMHIGIIDRMKETVTKEVLTEERVKRIVPVFRNAISFYREYPDIYIDTIKPPDSTFSLFFYQRIMMRAVMRYKYVYGTFTRAFSKSFLCVGANILRCIFFPGAKLFIASGSKEQKIVQHCCKIVCKEFKMRVKPKVSITTT